MFFFCTPLNKTREEKRLTKKVSDFLRVGGGGCPPSPASSLFVHVMNLIVQANFKIALKSPTVFQWCWLVLLVYQTCVSFCYSMNMSPADHSSLFVTIQGS